MSRAAASAICFTGGASICIPRPLGRSGWVSISAISCPASMSASSVGTANCGVPQKTNFTALPLASLLQLADAALDQIALQGTDPEDEQDAIQVIDLVLKGPGQQLFAVVLAPFA